MIFCLLLSTVFWFFVSYAAYIGGDEKKSFSEFIIVMLFLGFVIGITMFIGDWLFIPDSYECGYIIDEYDCEEIRNSLREELYDIGEWFTGIRF